MQQPLTDKVALVVSGMGEGALTLAVDLANKGADVAIAGLDTESDSVRQTKKQIESLGRRLVILREQPRAFQGVVQETLLALERIDVFIDCSSGICNGEKRAEKPRNEQEMLSPILANVEMLAAALRHMVAAEQLAEEPQPLTDVGLEAD